MRGEQQGFSECVEKSRTSSSQIVNNGPGLTHWQMAAPFEDLAITVKNGLLGNKVRDCGRMVGYSQVMARIGSADITSGLPVIQEKS